MAMIIAVGGIVLTGLIAWLVVAVLTDGKPKSEMKSSGPPAVEPLPTESRPERQVSPERPAAFLPNGTWVLAPRGTRGRGVLRIQNGSDLDSAVKLVSVDVPRKVFWIVYIRAHEEKAVDGIAVGTYLLRFALGRDWDTEARKFLQNTWFYQAGKQLVFTEAEPTEDHAGEYTELHVTLNEVLGGNLPRVGITEAQFNEGSSEN
jgi:hypothetical protein